MANPEANKNAPKDFGGPECQAKATAAKKDPISKAKRAATQAITKSSAIAIGRNKRITPEIQEYIRQELLKPNGKGSTYMENFISAFLKEAKNDPNSRCGQLLASAMFSDELLKHLDEEANKQMAKDREFLIYRIRNTLYDKQQEVFDNNLDQAIQAICTRRAGKTELTARLMLKDASKPNHHVLYINRTFDNAVKQAGKPLTDLLTSLCIPFEGSPGGGMVKFDNGSDITFGGFYNKGEIDKFRGFKYSLVLVDEIGHLRNPKMLIQEVLEPAMMDFGKESQIVYTGTPPRIKKSFAYELWHNPNIKHYHWSFMDNPFIPDKEGVIDKVCKEHGLTVDAPFIQREYYGNMEAFDVDAMIFRGYKTYNELPKGVVFDNAYIGVDWGFEDAAAVISGVVYNKVLYIIDQWSETHKAISETCAEIKRQYDNLQKFPLKKQVWVITDTNNKEAAYEAQVTYKIPNVFMAYKYDKDVAIDQLAEFMRTGKILIQNKGILQEEAENTLWARDEETDEILHELSDEYHPNALFALLYISRQAAVDVWNITDINKEAKKLLGE